MKISGVVVAESITGLVVFVDRGAGLVGVTVVTDRSHAIDMTMNMERNKKNFFTVELFMVEFPFMPNRNHQE